MWICNRCQARNREGDACCIQCSAPRSARRFGAGTVVETPSVSGAAAQPVRSPQVHAAPPPREGKAAPQAGEKLRTFPHAGRPRNGAAGLLAAAGICLAILLPALLLWLAVAHYNELSPQLDLLFFPRPAAEVTAENFAAPAPALSIFIYTLVTAIAALASSLPGLLAIGLGRLLVSLTHPQGRFR